MKSVRKGLIVIIGAVLIACGQDPSTIKLENDRKCRPLQVKVGQELVVVLKGNLSTGYRWLMVSQPSFLSLIKEENIKKADQGNQLGRPDVSTWQYKVHSKGEGNLRFIHQRPWESGSKDFNCKIISE